MQHYANTCGGRDADRAGSTVTLRDLAQRRWLLSSLLIAGAALFVIGVTAERNTADTHTETSTETAQTDTTAHVEEAGGEEAPHTEESATAQEGHTESSSETVFGVNLESTALVIVAAIASLTLAALTWRWNLRLLLVAAVAFAVVFAVVDIAELVHQIEESRVGIAALAAAIAVLHIVAALVAEQRATNAPT